MLRYAVEGALQRGELWAAMRNGRYWRLRRNGATKLWKRAPDRFSIPVKCGMKSCTRITETSSVGFTSESNWRNADFVVCSTDPNTERKTA